KARDLDPVIRGGVVVEADLWGEIWRDLQNTYFEEKGYDIKVDPTGILPQEHLGPVRMRHHLNEALLRAELLQKANEKLAQDPLSVLEELTRNQAVFTQKDVDLFLQKHVPPSEREGLLEAVLEHSQILPLYDKDTKEKTGHFTTQKVRAEEEKLLRFADTIAKKTTVRLSSVSTEKGLEDKNLSDEQKTAYDLCVNSGQNLSIIQGRAGVGKSYLLDAIRVAYETSGFRVLGLAPTNKIAMDLRKNGFQDAKTCHSFLFAFKNNREKLDSKTVVIADEAGMLGTQLSVELLNAIKSKGAKLILVGDDRQLNSVERGGTFRFLADQYGAVELAEVRRQTIGWQKAVSESLSQGNIKSAVHLLEDNKALIWNSTKEESLAILLKSWARDSMINPHETRQIIAQRNVDVDALNQGARDVLRQSGRLGDLEIICSTQRGRMTFSIGDRIQFTKTDKQQGFMNGSFGMIEKIDPQTKNMTIQLDNGEVKDLNPNTYDGLRHGYAATVYKTQGATLSSIYVLHSKGTNQPTNYVSLTRQTKSLSVYLAQDETPSTTHLIRQMERQQERGTSLVFDTLKDIEKLNQEKSFFSPLKETAEVLLTKVKDTFHRNEAFYKFEKQKNKPQEPAVVSVFKEAELKEKALSLVRDKRQNHIPKNVSSFGDVKAVEDALKQNIADFADHIFSSIGEEYNRATSSTTERRYGKKGHISVNLHTGAWIDYKNTELAGGPLHLLTKIKGLSFKEAVEYGASWAGLSPAKSISEKQSPDPSLSSSPSQKREKENLEKEAEENKIKVEKAQALWAKGQPLQGTIAERYLKEHRKIEREYPQDLRYVPNVKLAGEQNAENGLPCLIVAARSKEGDVTAVQLTFLDPTTAQKADIPVQKRSYGLLKGSAVTIQENKASNILFIAEGIETALSLKEAGIKGTIKASLGLSNIKRLAPQDPKTHIVICGDHDAPDSPAVKSLEKSVTVLQEKGFKVTVLKPDHLGEDFNDVLKKHGHEGVRKILIQAIPQGLTQPILVKDSSSSPVKREEQDVFNQITKNCEKYLYTHIAKENISFTSELKERIPLQAERAATFIFHAHTLKKTEPTEKETKLYLLRAKYELDRIPEISKKLNEEWHQKGHFDEKKDSLLIRMIAERQASIEGRLFFEAKQMGLQSSSNISELAESELKEHRSQTKPLAQKLISQHALSERAAIHCAKNILRYQETHGEKLTSGQMTAMAQISHQLEDKYNTPFAKEVGSHNIEYMRRMDGDLMFRERCSQEKASMSFEHKIIQAQTKAFLENTVSQVAKDLEKVNQRELSL
ncbi:MAG TPA: AAA family ATPase, partial [Alphaproteobacteria bacterium]|nr:AAA family ATPase [Alphaproteobacteria bacterium]